MADRATSGDFFRLESLLDRGAAAIGVSVGAECRQTLAVFSRQLLEINRRVNLTAARDPETVVREHILDALTLVPFLEEPKAENDSGESVLVDIGSGGGFPALPIAVVFPWLRVICIESTQKKAGALSELAARLGLTRVAVLSDRAETIAREPEWREFADWATARGVGRLATVVELALPFLRIGGRLLAQKGSKPEGEIAEAGEAIEVLGGRLDRVAPVELPCKVVDRTVVLIEKERPTPPRYPRRPGLPSKRPIRSEKR